MNKAYFIRQKVKNFVEREGLASPGQRILLAVSGGPDSMALMYILTALRKELGVTTGVAHLNHDLRPEAGAEEALVRVQAATLNLSFFSCRVDIRGQAARQGISVEEAGRLARYAYFEELAASQGFDLIATGHHQDDVAETVLHHLLRGSGMRGLQGILPRRGRLIRPLLELTKRDLESYVEELHIPSCRDLSNWEDKYTRNHIRNQLIPFLRSHYNPSIVATLNQTAAIMREETAYLNELLQSCWPDLVLYEADSEPAPDRDIAASVQNTTAPSQDGSAPARDALVLDASALAGLPLALRRRAVMQALESVGGQEKWSMNDVETVLELLGKTGSSKALNLKSGIDARKDYGRLLISRRQQPVAAYEYMVEVPGVLDVAETGCRFEFLVCDAACQRQPGDFVLDFDRLSSQLRLRSRRPGDRFQPYGLNGHKKIKDYLIDARIPWAERLRIPVLASPQGRIWALVGLRADAAVQPDSLSRSLLVIRRL